MAQGKKTSSKKRAEVIAAKLNNPDLSYKDIEDQTGVKYRTACNIIRKDLTDLCNTSDTLKNLIDDNNKLLNITGAILWDDLTSRAENGEEIKIEEITKVRDLAFKQNEVTKALGDDNRETIVKIDL